MVALDSYVGYILKLTCYNMLVLTSTYSYVFIENIGS